MPSRGTSVVVGTLHPPSSSSSDDCQGGSTRSVLTPRGATDTSSARRTPAGGGGEPHPAIIRHTTSPAAHEDAVGLVLRETVDRRGNVSARVVKNGLVRGAGFWRRETVRLSGFQEECAVRLQSLVAGLVCVAAALLLLPASAVAQVPDDPTFSKDIAPIFYDRCVNCHRPNQIAPMSLITYNEVRPWARSIRNKVETRAMPPWHLESHDWYSGLQERSVAERRPDRGPFSSGSTTGPLRATRPTRRRLPSSRRPTPGRSASRISS